MKRKIKINFSDFHKGFNPENSEYMNVLREKYDVEISDHPDYLIYSVFGTEYLKYDCVRIFYTGECVVPNFNECDYAIGFDRISFGDRYIRVPIYLLHSFKQDYLNILDRKKFTKEDLDKKEGFCSFVYSNCFAQDIRTTIFNKLSEYKQVSSGGRYLNNIGGAVKDKTEFQSKHKFSIAFENSSYRGYTTEKIVQSFSAYTIPIYYGDPDVVLDFNEKAFINCHNYKNLDEVVEKVKEIDQNDDLYLSMINENPIKDKKDLDAFKNFLYYIIDQDYSSAFRRPHSMYTESYDKMLKRHQFFEKYIYTNYKYAKNQITRLKTGTLLTSKRTK